MHNIYYNTKECGLTQVDCLDEANLSYEFNTLLILEATQSGRLYWAHSQGCSCPVPFEEYSFVSDEQNDLNEIRRETLDTFIKVVSEFPVSLDERQSAIRKVKYRLKKLEHKEE